MNVGTTQLGHGRFVKHLVSRKHKKDARKRTLMASLTLTAMVDMFSVLVVFLLQTFTNSPEILVITKGVTLPSAAEGEMLQDAPVLSFTAAKVFLDQKEVGGTNDLLKNPEPLMKLLGEYRERWQRAHPTEQFNGEITLQADREIDSTLISQFMSLVPSQAYSSIQLAIFSGGKP